MCTVSHPDSWSDPIGGSKPSSGCETIYWDSLLFFFFFSDLSDLGRPKSYNIIKILYTKFQNKTTTVVVFTMSYTYSSESYLYIQNYTLQLHDQRAEPTMMNP